MPENPIKIGFSSMFCVKLMLIPGAVPFSDLRSNQKRPNFGAQNRVPKNGPFF